MLSDNNRQFLFRAIRSNRCLLFVGAGFSRDARNRLGTAIPDANQLAADLWSWLGHDREGEYDGSPLSELYESALRSGSPMASLRSFLEGRLLAADVPDWYQIPTRIYWYRVYGTNVDNVIECAFDERDAAPRASCVNAVTDDYSDGDQFLSVVQYVKLNGSLPGPPENLTFSTRAYARRSAQFDQWYDHFVHGLRPERLLVGR